MSWGGLLTQGKEKVRELLLPLQEEGREIDWNRSCHRKKRTNGQCSCDVEVTTEHRTHFCSSYEPKH